MVIHEDKLVHILAALLPFHNLIDRLLTILSKITINQVLLYQAFQSYPIVDIVINN